MVITIEYNPEETDRAEQTKRDLESEGVQVQLIPVGKHPLHGKVCGDGIMNLK